MRIDRLLDIVIVRDARRLHFDYTQVARREHLEQSILLQSGDIIVVR